MRNYPLTQLEAEADASLYKICSGAFRVADTGLKCLRNAFTPQFAGVAGGFEATMS